MEQLTKVVLDLAPEFRGRYDEIVAEGALIGADAADDCEELLGEVTTSLLARFQSVEDPRLRLLADVMETFLERSGAVARRVDGGFVAAFGDQDAPIDVLGPRARELADERRDWRAQPADMDLVRVMVAEVPALQEIADDNTYGLAGDVLVYPFLSEVVQRQAEQVAAWDLDEARRTAALAERLHSGVPPRKWVHEPDVGCDNTLAAGYVEAFPSPGEPGAAMVDLLGPKLRRFAVLDHPSSYALGPDGEMVHLDRPPASVPDADPASHRQPESRPEPDRGVGRRDG